MITAYLTYTFFYLQETNRTFTLNDSPPTNQSTESWWNSRPTERFYVTNALRTDNYCRYNIYKKKKNYYEFLYMQRLGTLIAITFNSFRHYTSSSNITDWNSNKQHDTICTTICKYAEVRITIKQTHVLCSQQAMASIQQLPYLNVTIATLRLRQVQRSSRKDYLNVSYLQAFLFLLSINWMNFEALPYQRSLQAWFLVKVACSQCSNLRYQ